MCTARPAVKDAAGAWTLRCAPAATTVERPTLTCIGFIGHPAQTGLIVGPMIPFPNRLHHLRLRRHHHPNSLRRRALELLPACVIRLVLRAYPWPFRLLTLIGPSTITTRAGTQRIRGQIGFSKYAIRTLQRRCTIITTSIRATGTTSQAKLDRECLHAQSGGIDAVETMPAGWPLLTERRAVPS